MKKEQAEQIKKYLSREGFYTEIVDDLELNRSHGWVVKIYGIKLGYELK